MAQYFERRRYFNSDGRLQSAAESLIKNFEEAWGDGLRSNINQVQLYVEDERTVTVPMTHVLERITEGINSTAFYASFCTRSNLCTRSFKIKRCRMRRSWASSTFLCSFIASDAKTSDWQSMQFSVTSDTMYLPYLRMEVGTFC